MLARTLTLGWLVAFWCSATADELFSVSLYSSSADLSGCYAAAVNKATQNYRGDGPSGTIIFTRSIPIAREMPGGIWYEQECFEPRPFMAVLLTLRVTTQQTAHASNQAMELTATRPENHKDEDAK